MMGIVGTVSDSNIAWFGDICYSTIVNNIIITLYITHSNCKLVFDVLGGYPSISNTEQNTSGNYQNT